MWPIRMFCGRESETEAGVFCGQLIGVVDGQKLSLDWSVY